MCLIIESTKAKVTNVKVLQDFLNDYWCSFEIKIESDEGGDTGSLTISGYDSFPEALFIDEWPDNEEYPTDASWLDAMFDLLREKGDKGFMSMLEMLADNLETPLTIVWSSISEGYFADAGQWTVWPGCPYIQVQKVSSVGNPFPDNSGSVQESAPEEVQVGNSVPY